MTCMRKVRCVIAYVALTMLSTAAHAVLYRVTDIGDLATGILGGGPAAAAINEAGQVAGSTATTAGQRAFLWDPVGGIRNLGTLGGEATGNDLNDAGEVVGSNGFDAVVYRTNGTIEKLGKLGSDLQSIAQGINTGGQIVGVSFSSGAFLFENGTGIRGIVGVGSSASDINDTGQVVGQIGGQAFFLDPGSTTEPLGFLPGMVFSEAFAVNALGHVVGASRNGGNDARAFLWRGAATGLEDLGDLDASHDLIIASSLNDAGTVVGTSQNASGPGFEAQAFIWQEATGMLDLNDLIDPSDPLASTLILQDAVDINESGQILATGIVGAGDFGSFVLTPVPLPGAAWLLLSALGLMVARVRRRR